MKNDLEDLGEEGTFLRRSVNDITSLMNINFGSLGRPSRGGRGRGGPRGGTRGGTTAQPQRLLPVPEVVREYKGSKTSQLFYKCFVSGGRFGT